MQKSNVELLPDDDGDDEPVIEDKLVEDEGVEEESKDTAQAGEGEGADVVWRHRIGKLLPAEEERRRKKKKSKKAKKAVATMFAPDEDVDIVSSQSESEVSDHVEHSASAKAAAKKGSDSDSEDSRPLHEIVVPPYSSEDEMKDVEIISFNGDKKKKKKKKKKRQGPIVGPIFEEYDIGLPPGEYVDITPLEPLPKYGRIDRGVMKKVLRPGKGPFPKAGTIIQVEHHQLGFLQADKRIFMDTTKTFLEPNNAKPERWVFGSDQQIPGLEAGIFTMRPGEKARFRLDWRYAYGERGITPGPPFIPPCADIFLDVTMFNWKPCTKERSAMNSAEMFEEAKRVKEEANYAFKESNFILDDVFTCISEGTPVTLADGTSCPIEQLVCNVKNGPIHVEAPVLIQSETHGDKRPVTSHASLCSEGAYMGVKPCVELTLRDGRTLTCTADHRLLTSSGLWEEAGSLQLGSSLSVAGIEAPLDVAAADEASFTFEAGPLRFSMGAYQERRRALAFARLAGHVRSDGRAGRSGAFAHVDCLVDVESVMRDATLLSASEGASFHATASGFRVDFRGELWSALASLADDGNSLPTFLEAAPVALVREFCRGAFGADGFSSSIRNADASPNMRHPRLARFCLDEPSHIAAAQAYMRQIQTALKKCGVDMSNSKITVQQQSCLPSASLFPDVRKRVEVRLNLNTTLSFAERVGFCYCAQKEALLAAGAAVARFKQNAGSQDVSPVSRLLDEFGVLSWFDIGKVYLRTDRFRKTMQMQVVDVKPVGQRRVYDVAVPERVAFFAGSVAAHNCIKLMFHEFIQTEWNAVRQLEGEALNNQGMCYIRMGDYEMSERRARKCLEILQENVKCLYRLGLSCNEQKKYEEAKKYLKYALCIKPDSLTIRDEYNRACKNIRDEVMAVKKTWKGAFGRTNKLGDKEEIAKLKENAELNQKLADYEKKKKERQEAIANKRAANPKTQIGKGTVLTPEQVAARYGSVAKKTVSDAILPSQMETRTNPDSAERKIDFEGLAKRAQNTLTDLGGPPMGRRTKAEAEFEKTVVGGFSGGGGAVEVDDSELSRYKAGEQRFAEIKGRREKMQMDREAADRMELEKMKRK